MVNTTKQKITQLNYAKKGYKAMQVTLDEQRMNLEKQLDERNKNGVQLDRDEFTCGDCKYQPKTKVELDMHMKMNMKFTQYMMQKQTITNATSVIMRQN